MDRSMEQWCELLGIDMDEEPVTDTDDVEGEWDYVGI